MRTYSMVIAGAVVVLISGLTSSASAEHSSAGAPTCQGETATIVVEHGDGSTSGTDERDVIVVRPRWQGPEAKVHAGKGDDVICGFGDLHGGPGEDSFANSSDSCVHGGLGDDRSFGGRGQNCMDGGRGADVMHGDAGGDVFSGGLGDDVFYGGPGRDQILERGPRDIRIDLARGVANGRGHDRLYSVRDAGVGPGRNVVVGTAGANLISALGDGDNRFYARGGRDRVFGGSATDRIFTGPGRDFVKSGGGADVVSAGRGDDLLNGGRGADRGDGGPGDDRCVRIEQPRHCEA
ncbi:calcium-binding protein [Solicola gregarius]|uniref:Calcium-binding protein n=1 Tax=Solicola gregarius TaxID=2908642 RepID=A0AA46YKZ6_9ACTN|nr:calcium-binding protein [Solicola gregarius]UYM04393.1 hypothetical protein L0C25_17910 [Solicola gregarius]